MASPYTLRRGDIMDISLNGKKKRVEVLTKGDRTSKLEPLFIGSKLFRDLEKKMAEAFSHQIKDSKGNLVKILRIKRV